MFDMARDRKPRPDGPIDYIDEAGRQAILARMIATGKKKAHIAKECDVTASAVTLLLKTPIPKNKPRGIRWAAALEKCLGMTGIAKKPSAPNAKDEATRRAMRVLANLRDDEQRLENWLAGGELMSNSGDIKR